MGAAGIYAESEASITTIFKKRIGAKEIMPLCYYYYNGPCVARIIEKINPRLT
jgi:hypothetical protein